MQDAIEEIEFLTRSPYRAELLAELADQELSRDELKDRCDASRTSLQRNLTTLEERGWIQNSNRTYALTRQSEDVTQHLLELIETINVSNRLAPFLRWIPDEELDFDIRALSDATVVVSDEYDPYAPVNKHIEIMESAEQFRCILPATGLQPMKVAHECVVEKGHQHEMILAPGVAETVRTKPKYPELVDEMVETGRAEFLECKESVPYFLGIASDTIQIGVGDEEGKPQALLETKSDAGVEWAEETFDSYKQQSKSFCTAISA